jgi:hypothetical protein
LEGRKENPEDVNATKYFGIRYFYLKYFRLIGYTDSDCGGNMDERKRTFGYTFHFGIDMISWASRKKPIMTLSSAEVEYVENTSATCQVVWMRRMLKYLL